MDSSIKYQHLPMTGNTACIVPTTLDRETFKSDLNRLACWDSERQMKLNAEKYKALHVGSNSDCVQYGLLRCAVNKRKLSQNHDVKTQELKAVLLKCLKLLIY